MITIRPARYRSYCRPLTPILTSPLQQVLEFVRTPDSQRCADLMGDAEEPSRWARLKPWYLLAIPTTLLLGLTALRSKKRMNLYLKEAKKVIMEFYDEHVKEPARAIVMEIFLNQRLRITDQFALNDTKQSLKRMIDEFLTANFPNMPEDERKQRAREVGPPSAANPCKSKPSRTLPSNPRCAPWPYTPFSWTCPR